ncbi:MAG: hypothetical protein ACFE0I_12780 [Elainellaceae cyanobacterium]
MHSQKVADMTVEELKVLVNQLIDERVGQQMQMAPPIDKTRLEQVMESIDCHRWTPPPGALSVVEMLREDRDR